MDSRAVAVCARISSVATMVSCAGSVPAWMIATGVSPALPKRIKVRHMAARWVTPMYHQGSGETGERRPVEPAIRGLFFRIAMSGDERHRRRRCAVRDRDSRVDSATPTAAVTPVRFRRAFPPLAVPAPPRSAPKISGSPPFKRTTVRPACA